MKCVGLQRHAVVSADAPRAELVFQLVGSEGPLPEVPVVVNAGGEPARIVADTTDGAGRVFCRIEGGGSAGAAGTTRVIVAHPETGAAAETVVDVMDPARFDALDRAARDVRLAGPLRILYLGDSLSDFDRGNNYADKVDAFLERHHPGKATFRNYGVAGDTVLRVWDRMSGARGAIRPGRYEGLFDTPYDIAFIFLGHNDSKASSEHGYAVPFVPPDQQEAAYRKIVERLRQAGIPRIVFLSPTSSDFETCKALAGRQGNAVHNRFGDPVHLEAFDAVLRKLAAELGVEHLDVYAPTRDDPQKARLFRENDGVHLSTLGHQVVAEQILRHLATQTP